VNAIDLHYGAAQALRNVSLTAEPGKVTCVLGRNGVGKTSLLDALAGQQSVSKGTIIFDGADITRLKPSDRARRGVAYVPQGREIFPLLTVEENLKTGFAPLKRQDRSIPDDVFSLFPVLNGMLGRRGGDLSGGQQQQLAIARALVAKPQILLLDEPSLGLAPTVVDLVFSTLETIRGRGLGILLVEQRAQRTVALADRTHVLANGELRLTLTPDDAADTARMVAAYLS
jgi:urea transport system ATP-binding protein